MSDGKITRQQFVDSFTQMGDLGLAGLTAGTKELLDKSGVSLKDLSEIAGANGVIDGADEYGRLFDAMDRTDRNGSGASFKANSVQGSATGALIQEVLSNRARANVNGARPAPRTPSPYAREHFREVMRNVKEQTRALEQASAKDRFGIGLKVGGIAAEGVEVGLGVAEAEALAGAELGMTIGAPLVALGAALYEIGEANEQGRIHNEDRQTVKSFADGVAAGLDPHYQPSVREGEAAQAAYEKGRQMVQTMRPSKRRELEDMLVLAHAHANTGMENDEGYLRNAYHGDTYAAGIVDAWEVWKP